MLEAEMLTTAVPLRRIAYPLLVLLGLGALVSACGSSSPPSPAAGSGAAVASSVTGRGKFLVVAGENFWGSIASQLAGDRARVESIIVNPSTDPHSYQPTAQDERALAGAKLAIVNGIGYDRWMDQGLASNPVNGRVVLRVGDLLGLKEGDNPHQWYSPPSVFKVIAGIVADYVKLDPGDRTYFAKQEKTFEGKGLAEYDLLRKEIRARYAGTPVGYSESIFQPLGEDLGLKLMTPSSFAKAIAEGTDVAARDTEIVDSQAQRHRIKVWVYNSQNVTPDVKRVTAIVTAQHIPIATVTETLSPASDSFQQWQVAELESLMAALHQGTGR
jgi:zinc/manganese transport system substrate-binding protein